MKKTRNKLNLATQTIRPLDQTAMTQAQGGSGTHINCTYDIIINMPATHRARGN